MRSPSPGCLESDSTLSASRIALLALIPVPSSTIFTLQAHTLYKANLGCLDSGPKTSNACTEDSAAHLFVASVVVSTIVIISSRLLYLAQGLRLGGKSRLTRNHIHIWIHGHSTDA